MLIFVFFAGSGICAGPNPAHDITNNPDVFLAVLTEVMEEHLLPRYLHEVDRLLPR